MLCFIMTLAELSFRVLYSLENIVMTFYAEKILYQITYHHLYFLFPTTYRMIHDFIKWLEIKVP